MSSTAKIVASLPEWPYEALYIIKMMTNVLYENKYESTTQQPFTYEEIFLKYQTFY
jgi:hypothetical protein